MLWSPWVSLLFELRHPLKLIFRYVQDGAVWIPFSLRLDVFPVVVFPALLENFKLFMATSTLCFPIPRKLAGFDDDALKFTLCRDDHQKSRRSCR